MSLCLSSCLGVSVLVCVGVCVVFVFVRCV